MAIAAFDFCISLNILHRAFLYSLWSLCPLWQVLQFVPESGPFYRLAPAIVYRGRFQLCQANAPRGHIEFGHYIEPIDLCAVDQIAIQTDLNKIASSVRLA